MTKYLLLLLMVIPLLVHGQNLFNISFGDNRTGEILQVFDSDIYRFEGQAGDRIWIRATDAASSIDASLKLSKGATLYQIVEGTGGDVEIFDFVLPESGIFDIEIYDRGRNDSGAYGLSLQRLNNPDYGRQIHCGDDIFDEISTHVGVKVYQFAVEPGDKAFAQLRAVSAHFEATLYLFNENGDLLAKSIRKANPFAMIRDINVLTAEKYSLFAFDANGNDQSEFGLTYQDLNDPTCGTKPVDCPITVKQRFPFSLRHMLMAFGLKKVRDLSPKLWRPTIVLKPWWMYTILSVKCCFTSGYRVKPVIS
ncbi:MAG: hypothetical protein HKN76_19830 [Saprospiraceae bacterium]|nr:hypothetical protein [Saprospiraceae bacterium]